MNQNKKDKAIEEKSKSGLRWFVLFLLMLISLPITFIFFYAQCSWGGCDQSTSDFVFLTEIVVGVVALIIGIVTLIKSKTNIGKNKSSKTDL